MTIMPVEKGASALEGYVEIDNIDDLILAAADASYVGKIISVLSGTYTLNADLIIDSDRHIQFQDASVVVPSGFQITTKSAVTADYVYSGGGTISWNAGSTRFDRTGGSDWTATTVLPGAKLFVWGQEFTISSSDTTWIVPTQEPAYGTDISSRHFSLYVPTENVTLSGNIVLSGDAADLTYLSGLAHSDFHNLFINVIGHADMEKALQFWYCFDIQMPSLSNYGWRPIGTPSGGWLSIYHVRTCQLFSVPHVVVSDMYWAGTSCTLIPIVFDSCEFFHIVDANVSGINGQTTSGTIYVEGIRIGNCNYGSIAGSGSYCRKDSAEAKALNQYSNYRVVYDQFTGTT